MSDPTGFEAAVDWAVEKCARCGLEILSCTTLGYKREKARAEKAERERDELRESLRVATEAHRKEGDRAIAAESALAEARHKALEEAAKKLDEAAAKYIAQSHEEYARRGSTPAAREINKKGEALEEGAALIRALASGNAPPPQDSHILSSCSPDCTTGPEGGVLHSVEHQYRLAGGSIKTCPVCGEERHGGTCADAALASGNVPQSPTCGRCGAARESPEPDSRWRVSADGRWGHKCADREVYSGERPAGPPDPSKAVEVLTLDRSLEETK